MEDYCTKVYSYKSCSEFDEWRCKSEAGCRWENNNSQSGGRKRFDGKPIGEISEDGLVQLNP